MLDVKKIPELTRLDFEPQRGLRLGAAVPCYRIYEDKVIAAAYPALADSARIIGGWQIQSRASIGGNLCNSSPAADSIPSLIVLDATCQIAGPTGRRTVPVAQFCTAPGKNVLGRGEFLVSLDFPAPEPHSGSRYLRFIPAQRNGHRRGGRRGLGQAERQGRYDRTIASGTGRRRPDAAGRDRRRGVALGQARQRRDLRRGRPPARMIAKPISDMRGPAEYRVHLVGVLTQRALAAAVERARAGA